MALATLTPEAIDRKLLEAIADPYDNPQTQTDRIDYLLERRLMATRG